MPEQPDPARTAALAAATEVMAAHPMAATVTTERVLAETLELADGFLAWLRPDAEA